MNPSPRAAEAPANHAPPAASPSAPASWPLDVLQLHLQAADASVRARALAMVLRPDAPLDACVDALLTCATLSEDDATLLPLVAVALGGVATTTATTAAATTAKVHDQLARLTDARYPVAARLFAAHGLFRQNCLPAVAIAGVVDLLTVEDAGARKVALLAITSFASTCGAALAATVAALPGERWQTELLTALARSAGGDDLARQRVEDFLLRQLQGQPLVPAGVAGYAALATLNPDGAALPTLTRLATTTTDAAARPAAFAALAALGSGARRAAPELARALSACDDPAQEEALCRALVQIGAEASVLPLDRVQARIASAPDRSAAAHCLLVCMHPKLFATLAPLIAARHVQASAALQAVLAQTHQTLCGRAPDPAPLPSGKDGNHVHGGSAWQ